MSCAGKAQPNDRRKEHESDALLLLDRFRRIPQNAPMDGWPSTAELQAERIYGLRPVNRIGDLKKGKYNGHCYDFEMISCGHGANRWRLHWPNRPDYPKNKNQVVLVLPASRDWYEREHGPRPSSHPWKTAFSEKRLADPDCFTLTPPEPR